MALPEPSSRELIRVRRRINRAMLFLGAAFAIAGARFFLDPSGLTNTAIGRALNGPFDDAWSACFLLGGVLISCGVAFHRPRLELPGVTLAFTAVMANAIAVFVVNGSRALGQLPLYVLALWVLEGRARDLRDLPRDRRRRLVDDPRDELDRVERRALVAMPPFLLFLPFADTAPATLTTLLIALLGGGIFTAGVQALLYRPQRRSLEGNLAKTAVEAADIALRQALERADELEAELDAERAARKRLEVKVRDCLRQVAAGLLRERDLELRVEELEAQIRAAGA